MKDYYSKVRQSLCNPHNLACLVGGSMLLRHALNNEIESTFERVLDTERLLKIDLAKAFQNSGCPSIHRTDLLKILKVDDYMKKFYNFGNLSPIA